MIAQRAGSHAAERYKRIEAFVKQYKYDPPYDLSKATTDLYAEAGNCAMALIKTKVERVRAAG